MATDALENPLNEVLDRIEQALFRLEAAVAAAQPPVSPAAVTPAELVTLRARHRKLKDTVTQEIQQLDLLLANLP